MLRPRIVLPLIALVAMTGAAIVIVVVAPFSSSPSSTASGLPTSIGNDPNRFTPAAQTSIPSHGAATIDANAAVHVLLNQGLSPGDVITPGTAHAQLAAFGSLNADFHALAALQGHYADDYPVWVVTASGTFTDVASSRLPGAKPQKYIAETLYVDGYTGRVLSSTLFPATPVAGTATSVP